MLSGGGVVPDRTATEFQSDWGSIPDASGGQDRGELPDIPGADRLTLRGDFSYPDLSRSNPYYGASPLTLK